jgi:hypothetical protein
MNDARSDDLRRDLRRCLADEAPSVPQRLLAFVRAVDLAFDRIRRQPDADVEPLLRSVLARAAVAIAPLFTAPGRLSASSNSSWPLVVREPALGDRRLAGPVWPGDDQEPWTLT